MNIKKEINRVLDQWPSLTYFGVGLYAIKRMPRPQCGRTDLLNASDAVQWAARWLSGARKLKTINRFHSSYGLKDVCEKAWGDQAHVSNGAFICGAMIAGFDIEIINAGPNAFLNLSEKFIKNQFKTQQKSFR